MAPTTATILIIGESGTGKELFARSVHKWSGRGGAFVPFNCGAVAESVAESILFGHRKGAFTGATEKGSGLIRAAHEGTLFLDEVSELTLPLQAKLLRVLQQKSVLPVGEVKEQDVDIRIVAATNKNLLDLVKEGRFKEDLYFRLARGDLLLPPLRDRGSDIVLIARALLAKGIDGLKPCRLATDAVPLLAGHRWPGNVRELENVLYKACLSRTGRSIHASELAAILKLDAGHANDDRGSDRFPFIQEALRGGRSLPAADIRFILQTSKTSMERLVATWICMGMIVRQGKGPSTRYTLPAEQDDGETDPRWEVLRTIAKDEERVTRRRAANALGVCERSATRILGAMVDEGILCEYGVGRGAGYRLAPSLEVVTTPNPTAQEPPSIADAAPARRERKRSIAGPSR